LYFIYCYMLNDRECIICNDVEEYAYNELTLVKCKNCDVFFHKICYGISNHNASSQGIVILCDPCQYELQIKGKQLNKLSSNKDLKCLICFNTGILKRVLIPQKFDLFQTSESKFNHLQNRAIWIHIECAIYSQDYITIHNWRTMSNIEILKPLIYINNKSCCFCNGNFGILRKCRFSQCMEYFHIHCLLKSPHYKRRNIKIEKNHLFEIYCHKHFKIQSQISLEQGQK
ncbi:protein with two PHD Zn fingers that is probably involved in chromatin function, partial [Cryptosporidium parvum Iowa II]